MNETNRHSEQRETTHHWILHHYNLPTITAPNIAVRIKGALVRGRNAQKGWVPTELNEAQGTYTIGRRSIPLNTSYTE